MVRLRWSHAPMMALCAVNYCAALHSSPLGRPRIFNVEARTKSATEKGPPGDGPSRMLSRSHAPRDSAPVPLVLAALCAEVFPPKGPQLRSRRRRTGSHWMPAILSALHNSDSRTSSGLAIDSPRQALRGFVAAELICAAWAKV
jgi:hypothetical protein